MSKGLPESLATDVNRLLEGLYVEYSRIARGV